MLSLRRPLILFGLASAALAGAENYQVVMYPVPPVPGFGAALGAGDNAMLTGVAYVGLESHAGYWTTLGGFRDLHPPDMEHSRIQDSVGGTYHCGGGSAWESSSRALFWVGGGAAVNLHPNVAGVFTSSAYGMSSLLQVGEVFGSYACPQCGVTTDYHGARWARTAASFTRMHAVGATSSKTMATDGVTHVGYGVIGGADHALAWLNNSTLATDLHPSAYAHSRLESVWGAQQGGYVSGAQTGGFEHAAIWAGTAGSMVDLNPAPFQRSQITGVRNGLQIGYGRPTGNPTRKQAIAWHGSAATWINLHSRLPLAYQYWSSYAEDIDNQGNIMGYVHNQATGEARPVMWKRI